MNDSVNVKNNRGTLMKLNYIPEASIILCIILLTYQLLTIIYLSIAFCKKEYVIVEKFIVERRTTWEVKKKMKYMKLGSRPDTFYTTEAVR